jgi:uncharacterized protein YecT (DUF1311 family)
MKRFLVLMLILTLILTSCGNINESNEPVNSLPEANQPKPVNPTPSEEDDNIDNSYFGQYQMSEDGFSKYVKDNVIDRDYEAELAVFQESAEFNTQSWVELESKYIEIWDKELNNIYNNLLKKLNTKEQEKLREAQKGWLQYHTKESEFVAESWEDFGLGSQGRVQSAMAIKNRIRERTLHLMEYYFMLGEDVVFLYKGTEK